MGRRVFGNRALGHKQELDKSLPPVAQVKGSITLMLTFSMNSNSQEARIAGFLGERKKGIPLEGRVSPGS